MKIRTYDGGGALGIVSARFVQRIDERVPGFADSADFEAGTSAGSLNAGARAIGIPPEDVVDLFRELGPKVFVKRDWVDSLAGGLDELVRADYSLEPLIELVKGVVGEDRTLADVSKHFMAALFCLDNGEGLWKPKFVHTWGDREWPLWAALVGSSAAPTFFPTFTAPDGREYCDGGVVNNNPSMSAVAKALKAGASLGKLRVLSIGTGSQRWAMKGGDLGIKQWLKEHDGVKGALLKIIFDGLAGVPDYQCAQLLGRYQPGHPDHDPMGCYVRLDLPMTRTIEMDEADRADELIDMVDAVDIGWVVDWVNQTWETGDQPVV